MANEQKQAIEKIALFFYFCFMDEGRVHMATQNAVQLMKETKKSLSWQSNIVRVTRKILSKQKSVGSVSHMGFVQGNIQFPEGANWGPWFEYRKRAELDSFTTVIWTKILHLPIEDVAQGLGVTEGTVRFRLSHALRDMGQIISVGVES